MSREEIIDKCKHPPERLYSWSAWCGTLCIGCCECGEILKGGVSLDDESQYYEDDEND